jgi:hypothetical protein
MADTGMSAGSVSVDIGGNLAPLQSSLAQAEQMVRSFDARLASALSATPGIGTAAASINATVDQTSASLARITAPAAAASTAIDNLAMSGVGASVSAKAMADALAATGGDLSKITPQMLGLAGAEDAATASAGALTVANEAATATTVALGAASAETSQMSAGVSREFSVLGSEIIRGNFSRIPGSLLVMNERLASTGTSVLSLKTMFGALGSLADVVFNPYILGFLAITIGIEAVVKLWESSQRGAQKATDALKEHDAWLKTVLTGYDNVQKAAQDYVNAANKLPVGAVQSDLTKKAADDLAAYQAALQRVKQVQVDFLQGYIAQNDAFRDIGPAQAQAKALSDLQQSFNLANPDLEGLITKLHEMVNSNADGMVRQVAQQMLTAAENAQQLAVAVGSTNQALSTLTQFNFNGLLGVGTLVNQLKALTPDTRTPLQQAQDDFNIGIGQARTTSEVTAAVNAYNEAVAAINRQKAAQDALRASTKATNEAQREAADLAKRVAAANDNAAFDLQTLGMNSQEKSVADTIKSVYGGAWQSQMQSTLATQLRVNAALSDFKDTAEQASNTFASTFLSDLRQGQSVFSSFADAAVSALDDISNKLIQMAIDNLWSNAFGSATSGGSSSGIFGMIAGLFGGPSVPHFASGTDYAPGGLSVAGENGPELINLPRGAQVFNASKTAAMLGMAANNGAANGNGLTVHIAVDARGAQMGVGAEVGRALADFSRNELPARVQQANANPYRRGYRPGGTP